MPERLCVCVSDLARGLTRDTSVELWVTLPVIPLLVPPFDLPLVIQRSDQMTTSSLFLFKHIFLMLLSGVNERRATCFTSNYCTTDTRTLPAPRNPPTPPPETDITVDRASVFDLVHLSLKELNGCWLHSSDDDA